MGIVEMLTARGTLFMSKRRGWGGGCRRRLRHHHRRRREGRRSIAAAVVQLRSVPAAIIGRTRLQPSSTTASTYLPLKSQPPPPTFSLSFDALVDTPAPAPQLRTLLARDAHHSRRRLLLRSRVAADVSGGGRRHYTGLALDRRLVELVCVLREQEEEKERG